ncbi:hypothetical protein P3T23_009262 [Paraburkholderia sp. GAS448]|jgi:hypothetical protein
MTADVIEGKREKVQESKVQNVERWSELPGEPRDTHAENVSCLINGADHELRYNSSDYLDIDSRWRVPELAAQPELGLWP